MRVPLEVTYNGVTRNGEIDELIRTEVRRLERTCDYLMSCRVAIQRPQQHQRSGNPYRVRIDLMVPPGHELVVRREPTEGYLHDPLEVVVRDAFKAARRQLEKLVRRQRGEVKAHPAQQPTGLVLKLFRAEGYGFLKTLDGGEVYFHRNSVLHGEWDRLAVGTGVRFIEREGVKGPQASSVEIVDKPGARVEGAEEPAVEPPLGWR